MIAAIFLSYLFGIATGAGAVVVLGYVRNLEKRASKKGDQ